MTWTLAGHPPAHIQQLLNQGFSQGQIAQRLKVSRQAVNVFCRNAQLHWTPAKTRAARERQAQARAMAEQGIAVPQIAEHIGISVYTVYHYLRAEGVRPPRQEPCIKGTPRHAIQAALNAGETRHTLSQRLGVSDSAVYLFCKRNGVSIPARRRGKRPASI